MLSDLLIIATITLVSVLILIDTAGDWYQGVKGSPERTVSKVFTHLIAIAVAGDMLAVYIILSSIDLATMTL